MGDADDKKDENSDEALDTDEAVEFLKLVEQARAEGARSPTLDLPNDAPKPRKRFGLKSKGKKKSEESVKRTSPSDEETPKKNPAEPKRISDETLMAILEGKDQPPSAEAPLPKKATPPPPKSGPPRATERKGFRWLETLLAVALTLFLVKTFWPASGPSSVQPSATPRPTVPATQGQSPGLTAIYFARALSLSRFSDAHFLLSPEKQAELAVSDLQQTVSEFLRENPASLTQIRVDSTRIDGASAQVLLKVEGSETAWEVTLLKQGDRWVVQALSGDLSI